MPAKILLAFLVGACLHAGAESGSPAGIWRGESLCATPSPACHDEKVVYHMDAVPAKPNEILIQADKIVDGKAITMGSGSWKYDPANRTLSMESAGRIWLLHIEGNRIEGTLTVPDNVVFRRMTLTKDH
jgi:hypothetical protein